MCEAKTELEKEIDESTIRVQYPSINNCHSAGIKSGHNWTQQYHQSTGSDIHRTLPPTAAEYTLSSSCGTFTKINHIPGHKHLNKFKRISMLSDHNGIKLEINNRYSWRIPKHLESKQHTSKWHLGQRSFMRNLDIFWTNHENTTFLKCEMQQKKYLEGNL